MRIVRLLIGTLCREAVLFTTVGLKRFKRRGKQVFISPGVRLSHPECMSLGRSVHIERGAVINCVTAYRGEKYSPELTIGDNTLINVDVHIGCARRIFIGNDVVTSARCQIIDHHHGYQDLETPVAEQKLTIKGPIVIEDQCWLATGVVVCSGVRIGRHSIIGANSVVTHDIPPCSLAAGAPARVIRPLAPRVSGKE